MYQLRLGRSISFLSDRVTDSIRQAVESGLDTVDLDICSIHKDREQEIEEYKNLPAVLEQLRASGLKLNAVHISFGHHWNFASHEEKKRLEAIENLRAVLPITDAYSPFCYVIHGSYEPITEELRPLQLEALHRSLSEMVTLTKIPFALESLPRSCLFNTSAEGIAIVDRVPGVKVCIDVNHFLKEDPTDAILALGDRIITTHISDYDFIDERHLLPGQGQINWMRLLGALERIGYTGVFNYEVKNGVSTAEVKENYTRLFRAYNEKTEF